MASCRSLHADTHGFYADISWSCWSLLQTERLWPVDVMDMWSDPERVHPVPERSLLPGFIWETDSLSVWTELTTGKPFPSSLTLNNPLLVLWFGQSRVLVEERGHEGQVQFGVSGDDVGGRYKLSAAQTIGLLQHELSPFFKILLLVTEKKTRLLG